MPRIRQCTACRQDFSWTGGRFTCSDQCALTYERIRSGVYHKRKQIERREEKIQVLTQTNKDLEKQIAKLKNTLAMNQKCWDCGMPLRFTSRPSPRFVHTFTTSTCSEYPDGPKPIPEDGMVGC